MTMIIMIHQTDSFLDMTRQTESPVQSDGNQTPGQVGRASRYGTRPKRGRKPGRRPGPINPEPVETNEAPGSDTEDSADRLVKILCQDWRSVDPLPGLAVRGSFARSILKICLVDWSRKSKQ